VYNEESGVSWKERLESNNATVVLEKQLSDFQSELHQRFKVKENNQLPSYLF
jgi:hypothetical protein